MENWYVTLAGHQLLRRFTTRRTHNEAGCNANKLIDSFSYGHSAHDALKEIQTTWWKSEAVAAHRLVGVGEIVNHGMTPKCPKWGSTYLLLLQIR